jgi:O-acetyl-ADP-ribose deacetylase (regulator of RNase III)
MSVVFPGTPVSSTNKTDKLEFGRGAVSKSILEKGGRSILDECKHRFPHGINYGQVVCTKAGRMNFKFICHGALPHWTPTAKYSIKVCIYLIKIKHFHLF